MSPSIDEVSVIANWLNQAPELKGSMDVVREESYASRSRD